MKRIIRKTSILLAVLMIVCSSPVMAAENASVDADVKTAVIKKTEIRGISRNLKSLSPEKTLKAESQFSATVMNYATDTPQAARLTLKGTENIPEAAGNLDTYFELFTVSTPIAGVMYLDCQAGEENGSELKIFAGEYNGTFNYKGTGALLAPGETAAGAGKIDVKKGQTWYIGVNSRKAGFVDVGAYVIPYETRTLKSGKEMITSGIKAGGSDSAAMFKITPTKSGRADVYLEALGVSNTKGYVTLLNSKKKTVSSKLSYVQKNSSSFVTFGVKKGTTYYLKVTGLKGVEDMSNIYLILYENKAGAIRKNTAKKKALTLGRKAKATVCTIPAAGKKTSQWYKFKVKKSAKTVVTVNAGMLRSGKSTITFYCGKKKVAAKSIKNGYINKFVISYGKKKGIAKKGSYYAVIKGSAAANGNYSVRYTK